MAFSYQPIKPLTMFKIIQEAFKLPTKNSNLFLPLLLLSFLGSSLLFTFNHLSVDPINADLTSKSISIASLDPESPLFPSIQSSIFKDIKELVGIEAIFITVSFIVSSLISISIIQALFLTLSNNSSNIHDLLHRLHGRIKGPIITKLYVKLLSLGCLFLLMFVLSVLIVIGHGSMVVIALGVVLVILGLGLYLYLALVWSVGVVMSVVEDDCYGLEAISKAGEIIKGRRWQGVKLVMVEVFIQSLIYAGYNALKAPVSNSMVSQLGIGFVLASVSVMASVFEWATSLVFYYDCKRSKEEDGGFMYAAVPQETNDYEGAIP